jgi:acyl carrier protein
MAGAISATDVRRLARIGMAALSTEDALALFDASLANSRPVLVPLRIERAAFGSGVAVPPLLRALVRPARVDGNPRPTLTDEWLDLPEEQRDATVLAFVRAEVAGVLDHADAAAIDVGTGFRSIGMDSLMAVELRNRLNRATGLRLPTTVVFDYPNTAELAGRVVEDLAPPTEVDGRQEVPTATVPTTHVTEDAIDEMDLAELVRLAGGDLTNGLGD